MTVVGIDQSYTRTGVSVARDCKLVECCSYDMQFASKSSKRKFLSTLVRLYVMLYQPDMIVVERVRLFSQRFVSQATVMALATLITTIVDATDVPVYSVDTRSWKARVIGSAKASKEDTVRYFTRLGLSVDHDAADSAGIALYPFCKQHKLRREA